jgi:protein-S-isoprenylcysteine O-methyltransferase Ste14
MSNALKQAQAHVPTVLFSLSAIVWIALAYYKLVAWSGEQQLIGIAIMVVYVIWLALESKVSTAESAKGHTQKDHGTLEFYAVARILTVTLALALPTGWQELNSASLVGAALFVAGIVWRLYAIRTLGKFYSHRVRTVSEHRIIDSGPYRFIRHPAYTGMLLSHLGFVLFFYNAYALGLYLILFIPSVVTRILVEEKTLFEIDGYAEFSKDRARLVPFIW